jgi:hypothetical protein
MKNNLNFGVCEGRHQIRANDGTEIVNYVFGCDVDPTDVEGLENHAWKYFDEYFQANGNTCGNINIYVTGLTVATIAIVNALLQMKKVIRLWHYDRETGKYFPQKVYDILVEPEYYGI